MGNNILQKLWAALTGGSRRQKLRLSKQANLRGRKGFAFTSIDRTGSAVIEGELWRAISDIQIKKGSTVRVIGTDGVFIRVEPLS